MRRYEKSLSSALLGVAKDKAAVSHTIQTRKHNANMDLFLLFKMLNRDQLGNHLSQENNIALSHAET